jgi:ketosteroid isomerase-like protein
MSASQNVETTKKGYEAFAAGDVEAALSNFDDSIEWIMGGNSQISGTYRGKSEVLGMLAKLGEQSLTTTPSRFIADDNDVVVLTEVTVGGETSAEADVFSFRDGKIVQAQSYADTAVQERVFGTK